MRNQNNHNVQWIFVENEEEDGKNIHIVTRGGTKIREYATKKDQDQYLWVRTNKTPQQNFDARKEKDTLKESRKDILKENIASISGTNTGYDVPMYDMPHLFDHSRKEKP